MLFLSTISPLFLVALALADSDAEIKSSKSKGCNIPFEFPAEAGGASKGIQIGERRVHITLPKDYKHGDPAPLILAFHDKGQTASEMEKLSYLSDAKLNPDSIVVYPEAFEDKWLSDEDATIHIRDIPFIKTLLDGLSERLCIDTDRISATGLGAGGGLVHLLACDPALSERISASALVNPRLFSGLVAKQGVKDEVTMMWQKCKPARIPMRLLEIHSENNTVNNYWAKTKSSRPHMPVVQWLVEWAHRNECGQGTAQPIKVEREAAMYVTPLESGSIHEGFVYPNKLQQAYYTCHERTKEEIVDSFMKQFQVINPAAAAALRDENKTEKTGDTEGKNVDVDELPDLGAKPPTGYIAEEEIKKVNDNLEKGRGVRCLQHFFLKNHNHGWPRVLMKEWKTEDITAPGVTVSKDDLVFDSTSEVLNFFKQHKLSDEHRAPNEKAYKEGQPNLSDDALNEILETIKDKYGSEKDAEEWAKGGVGEQGSGKKQAEKKETAGRVKDEL